MRAIPYALSVHHFISSVGADAGFAAIIGLAIMVLLFFAHARETANLRHRADDAEDALHRLEQYVDQLARAGVAPAASPVIAPAAATAAPAAARTAPPAPVAARTVTPAPVGMMAGAPAAPAGVGAPALSAATRLIPAADAGSISVRSSQTVATAEAGGAVTGLTAAAVMDPPAPPPSTTAGGANGGGAGPVRYPPPASAGQTASGRERPAQRPGVNRPAAAPTHQRRRPGQRRVRSRLGRAPFVLAFVLALVVIVGVLVLLTNSGQTTQNTPAPGAARSTDATSSAKARKAKAAATVAPSSVTVAVLNGTLTSNLAHDISTKLQSAGYRQGTIATATDQTHTSTIVGYLPNDKRDALVVAKSLKLGPASVRVVDPNNRSVACNGSATTCPAQVVVTVGADLASHG